MLDFASAWCDGFLTWTWSLGSALLVLVFLAASAGEASSRYAWEHVDRLDFFRCLVLFLTRFVSTPCSARSVQTAELGDGVVAMQACDPVLKKVDSTDASSRTL